MKRYLILALAVGLATVLIPAAVYARAQRGALRIPPETTAPANPGEETVAVYMSDTGKTVTLPMRDYVISAVAGEMPAVYEPEALKAQAAASVTLTRYLQAKGPDASLGGAVISTDPKRHQGYLSVEEMHRRWGEMFDEYYARVSAAADAVLPYTVTYKGAPAVTAFHAVSSGVTETAENMWGKEIPYLVNCESVGDKLSPGYLSETVLTPGELAEKLGLPETEDAPALWAGEGTYSKAGTLMKIRICGKAFTGADLREALSLRSAAVKLKFDGESFILSVTGYGHGVGMSQYGADYYARQGMTWREIIAHYYPGTEITELR